MALDLNSNMIIEYENGVRAALWCSQVALGHYNGLVIRIFGDKGALEWNQEYPDYLNYTPINEAQQVIVRGSGVSKEYKAGLNSRLPVGHPEGLIIAFANIYRNVITTILKKKNGEELTKEDTDFQNVSNGVDGVRFIHKAIESSKEGKWVDYK